MSEILSGKISISTAKKCLLILRLRVPAKRESDNTRYHPPCLSARKAELTKRKSAYARVRVKTKETEAQRKRRLEKSRQKYREKRAAEDDAKKRFKLKMRRERMRSETKEKREARLKAQRQYMKRRRESETIEARNARLSAVRKHMSQLRAERAQKSLHNSNLHVQDFTITKTVPTSRQKGRPPARSLKPPLEQVTMRRRLKRRQIEEQQRFQLCQQGQDLHNFRCGDFQQHMTSKNSASTVNAEILDPSEQNQEFRTGPLQQDVTSMNFLPIITEILCPPLQNKELRTGPLQQDATSINSVPIIKTEILDPSEQNQKFRTGPLQQDVFSINSLPVIKTETLDPLEQNQQLIDFPQHATTIDSMGLINTEIQDSNTNQFLSSNFKIEQSGIDSALDKSSRSKYFSESFKNSEGENFLIFKHKLKKCSVLLHNCLIPENLNSISAKFKYLRINTDVSKTFRKPESFSLRNDSFSLPVSEAHENKSSKSGCQIAKPTPKVRPNQTYNPKKKNSSIYKPCKCFKASDDSKSKENQMYENYSDSAQQLCSCFTSDSLLLETTDIVKNVSLFNPEFGKISSGFNKNEYNF